MALPNLHNIITKSWALCMRRHVGAPLAEDSDAESEVSETSTANVHPDDLRGGMFVSVDDANSEDGDGSGLDSDEGVAGDDDAEGADEAGADEAGADDAADLDAAGMVPDDGVHDGAEAAPVDVEAPEEDQLHLDEQLARAVAFGRWTRSCTRSWF
jgi:hypothetical protein